MLLFPVSVFPFLLQRLFRTSPAAPEDPEDPVISVLGLESNPCTPPTTEQCSNCASVLFDKPLAVNSSHLNAHGEAAAFADMSSALLNFIRGQGVSDEGIGSESD
jgi:hypothetical protein